MNTKPTPEALIISGARRDAKSGKGWLGTPLSQIPLSWGSALQRLIASGDVEIVERPHSTRAGATAVFVVAKG